MSVIRVPATGDPDQEWNHDTRTYTEWENGVIKEGFPRPYTTEENTLADVLIAQEVQGTNEASVRTKLDTWMTDLNVFIKDTTNATINQNPAAYLKNLARVLRLLIRIALRRFEGDD
jgi:hypothetical protein